MASLRKQICLVVGSPRGFTRSVLEALLKRGSKGIFACPDKHVGAIELKRLSALYGPHQVHFSVVDHTSSLGLEAVFSKVLDTFGEISFVVNSTIMDSLEIKKKQENPKDNENNIGFLALKYMGKQNGFQGGTLLNVNNLEDHTTCPPLHNPGLATSLALAGVKSCTMYRPSMDYPDSPLVQITDDQHSPYYQWDKYSSYTRDYTGYMAVHVGQTCAPGTAWAFNESLQLEEINAWQTQTNKARTAVTL